jgi:N-acetylglucosamine-6-phosphate deacetylase
MTMNNTLVFHNGHVLTDRGFERDVSVVVEDGYIVAVLPGDSTTTTASTVDLQGAYLVPGFIDTQVNGGGDVLFNDEPSVAGIAAVGAAHRRFGTTGFLPTLISDDLDVMVAAIDAVDAAIAAAVPGVLGIHLEGPVLNVARKGIHSAEKIRSMSPEAMAVLTRPGRGKRMVTLAPETVEPECIAELAAAGIIVSAGHTQADCATVVTALDHGLRGFTHLFNAMSPLTSREPGTVGAALYDHRSWCGIIVDGFHVDPMVLRLALRAAPLRRFMLVTDAMPSVGGTKEFTLNGETIEARDGKCVSASGTIAGSDLDMATALRNCVELLGLSLEQASMLSSANPAAFLGLDKELGTIAPGYRADLALLDERLQVVETWVGGEPS